MPVGGHLAADTSCTQGALTGEAGLSVLVAVSPQHPLRAMDRSLVASVSPVCCHQRSSQHRHSLAAGPLPRRHQEQQCRQPCRLMQLRALQQVGEADFEAEVLQVSSSSADVLS